MEQFIAYVLQFGHLNQQQIELVLSKANGLTLQKDQYYWEAGKTVRTIGFLVDGVIRVYYINPNGEAITRYFIDENHLILGGPTSTFQGNYQPEEYLQAATPCTLVIFTKQHWQEITAAVTEWESIVQKIIDRHHREKIERRSELVAQDATTRYLGFVEKHPTLVNRVPLSFIASYLGITQSSLSRIRKNIR